MFSVEFVKLFPVQWFLRDTRYLYAVNMDPKQIDLYGYSVVWPTLLAVYDTVHLPDI